MRVAVFVQGFAYGRGRATTAVELVVPMAQRGHSVDVFVPSTRFVHQVEGVNVHPLSEYRGAKYDLLMYNSGLPSGTLGIVHRASGKKLMFQHSYNTADPGLKFADLVWFPSQACASVHKGGRYSRVVVPPPIDPELYRTRPGRKVGLSLSSHWKGGQIIANVARALPQHEFLVVKDGRGNGVGLFHGLKNVTLVDFMEPRQFYGQCRIQVLPSKSESYGRVGVEGAVSGIPLVASNDPGIKEAMGGHGIYLPRTNLSRWSATIDNLMVNRRAWSDASQDVLGRAAKINHKSDQTAFCHAAERLVGR